MKWKKGKLGMALGLTAFSLALVVLFYLILAPRAVKVDVAKVTVGPFQETIRSDAILRSKDRYTVPAFADGDIKRVSWRVGDPVKKGATITELLWDVRYVPVRAPISGVISKVYRESAGPIRRGEPIVEIIDPSKLEVMAELLTTDAIRLRPGFRAWIQDEPGGPKIEARVTRVSKAGFVKPSALGVEEERTEVTADLVNPPKKFIANVGSNFHVSAVFIVSERERALKVPVGALFRDGPQWAVYVVKDGRAHKVTVEVSALGPQEAAIGSGLTEGQEVLVYPGDLVKDGSRLRIERVEQ